MQSHQIHDYRLDNGLRVLVRQDHRAPAVVAQLWYKVGSADEVSGATGLSHALEHMMFLGTQKHPKDQFSKIIGDLGGYENAFTSEDQTVYYEEIGKQHLEKCLALEADRMQHLVFDEKEVARELDVIKEERRLRVEDDPISLAWERFQAAANMAGAYHNPVIGWMTDIERLTILDLKKWYQQWYAPNHATLVVVGDVVPEEVLSLSKQYFADIPASNMTLPKAKPIIEPLGKRTIEVHAKAKLPFIIMGYDVPTLAESDNQKSVYALLVLQSLLDGGLSARFEKHLIREQEVAAEIGMHYDLFQRYPTQMIIYGMPAQKKDSNALMHAIEAEIEKVKTGKITQKELSRAKMNLISDFIYDQDSMRKQAQQLGNIATLGLGTDFITQFQDNINQVSVKELKQVAKQYLIAKRQTTAVLIPEKLS